STDRLAARLRGSEPPGQYLARRGHRSPAMAHHVLGLGGDFREGGGERRIVEERVVAEATATPACLEQHPFDHSLRHRLAALRRAQRDQAAIPRPATRLPPAP